MESEAGFAAPIVREKKNGRKLYYYDNPEFSVIGVYSSLHNESLELIANTKGILPLEWISERLFNAKHPLLKKRTLIRFTHNPFVAGQLWVKKLYELMLEQAAVRMDVQLGGSIIHYQVHPWQLREHKGRWFILGKENNTSSHPIIFALADVIAIEPLTDIKYQHPTDTDWDELFEDSIGPFPYFGTSPQLITVIADENGDKILKNEPLHHSQKRKISLDGKVEYHYKLIIDKELERQLLTLGPDIYVSKPEILSIRMKELIDEMQRIYTN
jgi:hypothetical protein